MSASTAERARAAAVSGFDWVAASAVEVDGGRGWTEDGAVEDGLYSGAVGVLLACAEARANSLDAPGLADAATAARDRVVRVARGERGALRDDGLFDGTAGLAAVLHAWGRATGDDEATAAADEVLAAEAARASTPSKDAYTDIISGEAGRLVALASAPPTPETLDAATVVADRLVAAAEDSPDGPQWRMVPDYPILMPNFSHGTAGVAYALALAGDRLGRPDLTAEAVRGAETLLAIGATPTGWALPLSIPRQAHRPPVSFGWCHGPSGTLKLFALLAALQPDDPRWPETVAQCYDAVRTSGLPARLAPGFWDNVARCCGTAGVGTMVLDRYQATGDPDVLAWADVLADDVLDRAIATPHGTTWSNHEHTAPEPDLPPEPGFMQGTAGIAGWLARLAAVHDDPATPGLDLGVPVRWV